MKRYLIRFSYDGSLFKGYQRQPRQRTVQSELEKAIRKISNKKILKIYASGRTDAGVHALNHAAHFDLKTNMDEDKLKYSINSVLPDDIYVKDIKIVSDKFHARFDVKAKEYVYIINQGEYNPLEKKYIYQYNKKLDLVSIERGIKYLEGKKDFKSFISLDKEEKDKDCVRNLSNTNIKRIGDKIELTFLGEGFLRYMIRNMVGTLIEIGEGKRKSEDIIDILEQKNRKAAGKTANPEGLYLKDVYY